ncbi:MAG: YajQ family cyclic di-GMP-binding protein [Gammaproteobacteria bacterium]|nr:YajQ family cyclic di-GMP-binding protein [Gammaproteobacteria bacterium]
MPSFDIVSEVNLHELTNAVDQTNREITSRFDFKGTGTKVEQQDHVVTIVAQTEFQVKQVVEILRMKISKRGIDVACLDFGPLNIALNEARQNVTARHGLDKESGKKVVKFIKETQLKVQAQIQDEQVRVMGKKRDDLQAAIAALRPADLGMPLQFTNFRD